MRLQGVGEHDIDLDALTDHQQSQLAGNMLLCILCYLLSQI